MLLFVASSACAAYVPRVQRTAPPRARAAACAPGTASEISDAWFKVAVDTSAAADGAASAPLDDVRASAAAQLSGLSFPGRKIEAWRRTDLSSLASAQLVAPQSMDVESMVADSATEATDGARLVLVDGVCNAALSDLSALPSGVSIGSLLNAGGDAEASVRAALRAPLPEAEADVRTALGSYTFAALNQASVRDVAYIHVPPEVSVDIPIHVLYLSSGADAAAEGAQAPTEIAASHPSLIVSVGTNASVHVLQQYRGSGSYWTNALTRILLDEDSTIQHSYVQEQAVSAVHLDSIQVEAAAGACYENALLQSGGRIGRINQLVNLNGPGARSELRGLALATGNQVSDLHSFVRHVRVQAPSRSPPPPPPLLRARVASAPTPCRPRAVVISPLRVSDAAPHHRFRPTARAIRSSATRSPGVDG